MSPSRLLSHWRGLLLSLVGIAAIAWLAATGRLGLYIHPRYFVFTIVMAVIAGVVAIVAFALLPSADEDDDDGHGHHDQPQPSRSTRRWSAIGTIALVALTAGALLLVPPSTLTTSTVEQRAMNASAADSADAPQLVGGDSSAFTVKDWAGLLRSGADPAFLADAEPTVVGFVTPDPDDPENVFYVARFIVTCCAVDAQPVGVPIYLPGWQDDYPVDSWVEATGSFVDNPSTSSMQPTVLDPTTLAPTTQPADPYVY